MKKFIKAVASMAMALTVAFSSITVMAADPVSVDVSKAEFVTGVQAVDAKDFTEMLFSVYTYKDKDYAFIHKGDEDGFFTQVEVAQAEFENMTNCYKYKVDGKDYIIGTGEFKDGTMALMDSDGFIGSGRKITEKESQAAVNGK